MRAIAGAPPVTPYLLIDLLFPSRCVACGSPVTARRNHLCGECAGEIAPLRGECPVCSGAVENGLCLICGDRHWYPGRSIIVSEYRGVMKSVIGALKFDGLRGCHRILAPLALESLARSGILPDLVTWVPMNARKRWKRGFNQSELIARHIAARRGLPARELIVEMRNSPTQRELGLRGRLLSCHGRYRPRRGLRLGGKAVLLVDDVFTTGATINECARLLLEAGSREIFSLAMARADIKRLEMF